MPQRTLHLTVITMQGSQHALSQLWEESMSCVALCSSLDDDKTVYPFHCNSPPLTGRSAGFWAGEGLSKPQWAQTHPSSTFKTKQKLFQQVQTISSLVQPYNATGEERKRQLHSPLKCSSLKQDAATGSQNTTLLSRLGQEVNSTVNQNCREKPGRQKCIYSNCTQSAPSSTAPASCIQRNQQLREPLQLYQCITFK